MANAVLLPKLGQTVEEATIVAWHKNEGDTVKKGDVLFEIETDKAVLEAESFYEGTLLKVFLAAGKTAPVSSVVAYIGKPGEKVPDAPPAAPEAKPAKAPESAKAPEPEPEPQETAQKNAPVAADAPIITPEPAAAPPPRHAVVETANSAAAQPRKAVSPRARALCRAKAIDSAEINGSGPGGRVTEKDVRNYMRTSGYDALPVSPAARDLAVREKINLLQVRGTGIDGRIMLHDVERSIAERPVEMTKMRKIIAQRLTQSFSTIPHFYLSMTADMTDLLAYRQELKEAGSRFTVTDFILEAVVMSLQEFPELNSVTDGTTTRWRGCVDLGLAVGLPQGLVVPVIKNAGMLSLNELRDAARDLTQRARDGKLLPDEMTGSSFTVSNLGMLGVDTFNAIINPGEAAILAVGRTTDTVVPDNGSFAVRSLMNLSLSCDHRIVDGIKGAEFIGAIKNKLEDIALWKRLT